MLLQECTGTGVQILTDCETRSVAKTSRFDINTSAGSISADSLVVATGGLSIPKLGGSGFGYDLARQFGLSVLPLRAGLVPFTFSDPIKAITERLSGLSLDVRLSTAEQEFNDAMLFTHRGLSGPAVLQLSSYWHSGETISIDLLPGANLADWLKQQKSRSPRAVLRTLLSEKLPRALVMELQALWWPQKAETTSAEWSDHSLEELARQLGNWQVKPSGTEGYRTAEVTLGGVDTELISSRTMECKNLPGLFFIGEVLDVTGHLGGFNFQWAWSSGHAAGEVA